MPFRLDAGLDRKNEYDYQQQPLLSERRGGHNAEAVLDDPSPEAEPIPDVGGSPDVPPRPAYLPVNDALSRSQQQSRQTHDPWQPQQRPPPVERATSSSAFSPHRVRGVRYSNNDERNRAVNSATPSPSSGDQRRRAPGTGTRWTSFSPQHAGRPGGAGGMRNPFLGSGSSGLQRKRRRVQRDYSGGEKGSDDSETQADGDLILNRHSQSDRRRDESESKSSSEVAEESASESESESDSDSSNCFSEEEALLGRTSEFDPNRLYRQIGERKTYSSHSLSAGSEDNHNDFVRRDYGREPPTESLITAGGDRKPKRKQVRGLKDNNESSQSPGPVLSPKQQRLQDKAAKRKGGQSPQQSGFGWNNLLTSMGLPGSFRPSPGLISGKQPISPGKQPISPISPGKRLRSPQRRDRERSLSPGFSGSSRPGKGKTGKTKSDKSKRSNSTDKKRSKSKDSSKDSTSKDSNSKDSSTSKKKSSKKPKARDEKRRNKLMLQEQILLGGDQFEHDFGGDIDPLAEVNLELEDHVVDRGYHGGGEEDVAGEEDNEEWNEGWENGDWAPEQDWAEGGWDVNEWEEAEVPGDSDPKRGRSGERRGAFMFMNEVKIGPLPPSSADEVPLPSPKSSPGKSVRGKSRRSVIPAVAPPGLDPIRSRTNSDFSDKEAASPSPGEFFPAQGFALPRPASPARAPSRSRSRSRSRSNTPPGGRKGGEQDPKERAREVKAEAAAKATAAKKAAAKAAIGKAKAAAAKAKAAAGETTDDFGWDSDEDESPANAGGQDGDGAGVGGDGSASPVVNVLDSDPSDPLMPPGEGSPVPGPDSPVWGPNVDFEHIEGQSSDTDSSDSDTEWERDADGNLVRDPQGKRIPVLVSVVDSQTGVKVKRPKKLTEAEKERRKQAKKAESGGLESAAEQIGDFYYPEFLPFVVEKPDGPSLTDSQIENQFTDKQRTKALARRAQTEKAFAGYRLIQRILLAVFFLGICADIAMIFYFVKKVEPAPPGEP